VNKTWISISTLVIYNSKPCIALINCDDKWQALSSHHSRGASLPADRGGAHGSCWEVVPLLCGEFRGREAQAAHHLWRQVEGIGLVDLVPCRSLGQSCLGDGNPYLSHLRIIFYRSLMSSDVMIIDFSRIELCTWAVLLSQVPFPTFPLHIC